MTYILRKLLAYLVPVALQFLATWLAGEACAIDAGCPGLWPNVAALLVGLLAAAGFYPRGQKPLAKAAPLPPVEQQVVADENGPQLTPEPASGNYTTDPENPGNGSHGG